LLQFSFLLLLLRVLLLFLCYHIFLLQYRLSHNCESLSIFHLLQLREPAHHLGRRGGTVHDITLSEA
jgi:hypothetical protein